MAKPQWSLGAKLTLLGAPFLLLVLFSTAATLWVSWQLNGGAAAVNEAGRMRMQTYRMSLSVSLPNASALLPGQIEEFERSLSILRTGDPERPLLMPWDTTVREKFATVVREWSSFRTRWLDGRQTELGELRSEAASFVADIDALVVGIESHMARWTSLLHLFQISVLTMAVGVTAILIYTGYVFVLAPVGQLKQAIESIQEGNFDVRVGHESSDEFGTLAKGFNGMAENLQHMYRHLEQKVAEKTSELEEKRERLQGLYEVTALVANTTSLDELAQAFAKSVLQIARADGVTVRWSDQDNQRYLMLAAQGMPEALVDAERCIDKGDCYCGAVNATPELRIIPLQTDSGNSELPCAKAGFRTVINVPVRLHERQMGEVDLFFNARISPTPALRFSARSARQPPRQRHGEPASQRAGKGSSGSAGTRLSGARTA